MTERTPKRAYMLARGLAGEERGLRAAIDEIASIAMADGVDFGTAAISVTTIQLDRRGL